MDKAVKPIAIIQGARSAAVQQLFSDFAARWSTSARIVGVIEHCRDGDDRTSGPGTLRSVQDGRRFALYQDLGPGSVACGLDAAGAISAGEAVRQDIARGCDLVVLSKFGKLEAENRSGLIPAFWAALEAGLPVLTSVAPKFAEPWDAFAAPLYTALPPEPEAMDQWWRAVRQSRPAAVRAA